MDPITGAVALGGGLLNEFFGRQKERRHLKYQQKYTDMHEQSQKNLAVFGHGLQKDMYDYTTDYSRKMQKIKDAGLNPQMILAGGGGGGGTVGQGVGGAGGNAPESRTDSIGKAMDIASTINQQKIQKEMAEANIELTKAQAEESRVRAEDMRGIGRDQKEAELDLTKARISDILEGTKNKELEREGWAIDNDIKRLNYYIESQTFEHNIRRIEVQTEIYEENLEKLIRDKELDKSIRNDIIEQYRLNNLNIIANTLKTNAMTNLTMEQASKMAHDIDMDLRKMTETERNNRENNAKKTIMQVIGRGADDVYNFINGLGRRFDKIAGVDSFMQETGKIGGK